MEYDVTVDRESFIGGSDVPCIMGISPFKTRYQLLLEKAGLAVSDFTGNKYTVYGQKLEPYIRDYINQKLNTNYEPNRTIKDGIRAHTDGFNGESVLEIKTTSKIHDDVNEYSVYLVQLLLYMQMNGVKKGLLAVYNRPSDFDDVFDAHRLELHDINAEEYIELIEQINAEIERFKADLERIKANPLLSEEDFQPNELVALSNRVLEFENRLAEYKSLEEQYKSMKAQLYEAMAKHDVKSWQTVNGVRITRVDGGESRTETVREFDEKRFKKEQPELYESYIEEKQKKVSGRLGYVKITMPREKV